MPSAADTLVALLLVAAVAVVVAQAVPADEPSPATQQAQVGHPWRLSSHTCRPTTPSNVSQTCTFTNLYLWGGKAYYITEGTAPDFDSLRLDLELWREVGIKDTRMTLPAYFEAATPALFSALIGAGSSSNVSAATSGMEIVPLAYFWRGYFVLKDASTGALCDGEATVPGLANYYHMVAEYLPLLSMTLCEQFGHCDPFANRSSLQLIDIALQDTYPCNRHENYPGYYNEALTCFSDRRMRHINGPSLSSQLTLLETGWIGYGARCRGMLPPSGCYAPASKRATPTPALMQQWRRVAQQCFGHPDVEAVAPLHPVQVLVIDRLYESGRSVPNIASVMRALRSHFHPQQVQLRLEYLEGLSIRHQAKLFSQSAVVVQVHGAAIGNWHFLPKRATAVHISPFPRRWPPTLAFQMAHDLRNVTDIEVTHWVNEDWSRVQMVPEIVAQQAGLPGRRVGELRQNKTFMALYKGTFECPGHLGPLKFACTQYLSRALTATLPPEKVVNLVQWAVARAFQKQGQQWQPLLPSAVAPEAAATATIQAATAAATAAAEAAGNVTAAQPCAAAQPPAPERMQLGLHIRYQHVLMAGAGASVLLVAWLAAGRQRILARETT